MMNVWKVKYDPYGTPFGTIVGPISKVTVWEVECVECDDVLYAELPDGVNAGDFTPVDCRKCDLGMYIANRATKRKSGTIHKIIKNDNGEWKFQRKPKVQIAGRKKKQIRT